MLQEKALGSGLRNMMAKIIKRLWDMIPSNKRVLVVEVILLLLFAVIFACFFLLNTSEPGSHVTEHIQHQIHELDRAERTIEAIEQRKEAELNAVEKNVSSADVIGQLDKLLGSKRSIAEEKR